MFGRGPVSVVVGRLGPSRPTQPTVAANLRSTAARRFSVKNVPHGPFFAGIEVRPTELRRMAERTSPTPEEFEDKFRESIRVGFNWDRFLLERWPIERLVFVSEYDLGRCFTPWYVGKGAEELPYDHPHAV